jgi:hypothetical protein
MMKVNPNALLFAELTSVLLKQNKNIMYIADQAFMAHKRHQDKHACLNIRKCREIRHKGDKKTENILQTL